MVVGHEARKLQKWVSNLDFLTLKSYIKPAESTISYTMIYIPVTKFNNIVHPKLLYENDFTLF